MGNLIEHAKRVFLALGYKPIEECEDDPNKWIQENVLDLIRVFSEQGHSGTSAPFCIDYFTKLANFLPIGPLTGDGHEWHDYDGDALQNNRCSSVFKDIASGVCYNIYGFVFWHWCELPLESDEDGYPGVSRFKSSFTSNMSLKRVTFPYTPTDSEYVEVESYEVNKETNEPELGSGWWETKYPDHIEAYHRALMKDMWKGM